MEDIIGGEMNAGEKKEQLGITSDESEEEGLSEKNKAWYKKRKCTFCDKIFLDSAHRKFHETTMHLNQGRLNCTECDKSYTNITSLNYHLIVTHKKGVRCNKPSCNITYYNFARLVQHKKEHHSATKDFDEDTIFRNVTRIQNSPKCICKTCGKHITVKNMARHQKLVHVSYFYKRRGDILNHKCPSCPKMFDTKGNLTKHIKRKHVE